MPQPPTADPGQGAEPTPPVSFARFDLEEEIRRMRATAKPGGHVGKTLVRAPDLRLVLMILQRGAKIPEHHAGGSVSIQGLDGRVILTSPESSFELEPGHLLVLEHDVPHALEAAEDSAVLLTIAWRGHSPG